MTNESLNALHTALINLSKSGAIHFKVTANQYSQTKLAILQAEGVNLKEYTSYAPKIQEVEKLNREIELLRKEKERLKVQILELKEKRKAEQEKVLEPEIETA